VVVVEGSPHDDQVGPFFEAVRRAALIAQAGSLLAARITDIVLLADTEADWERFAAAVVAELRGGECRIGVGGLRTAPAELPRSYQEAQLALKVQKAVGASRRVTLFENLGVYQVLATADDSASTRRYIADWLTSLLDYDANHGSQVVATLSEYLESGGNYDATTTALSIHRSTLKYRLRRIREVSGHDLSQPDTRFNLQLATRAWRIRRALDA
jgi:DNA-binding PucR family transcriptional regulator